MNTILEKDTKLDKLQESGYKIIWPNSIDGLTFQVKIEDFGIWMGPNEKIFPIKSAFNCHDLNILEKFKNRKSLFLSPHNFGKAEQFLELRFKRENQLKTYTLTSITVESDSITEERNLKYFKRIKYVLFNAHTGQLIFYIDDNFKTKSEIVSDNHQKRTSEINKQLNKELKSLLG